jgi:hypothetical protein
MLIKIHYTHKNLVQNSFINRKRIIEDRCLILLPLSVNKNTLYSVSILLLLKSNI